jgi:transcriptional regulator with XRE-family HTH domain
VSREDGDLAALGRRLRLLREGRAMSLRAVAVQARVSESFLSQVERGQASPSIASLQRIATSLGTSIAALFEEGATTPQGRVVRASERRRMVHPKRKWEDSLVTPAGSTRLQVILSVVEAGGGSGDEPYSHDSDEECVLVLSGRLHFWVGPEFYELNEGDSLLFESRVPHRNRNPGPSKTEILWIITPPSY